MTAGERAVYAHLDRLGISYERHEHPPVFTVEQALEHWAGIDAVHGKNLFLRNKKGNRHFLVVAAHSTPVDLAALAARVGESRLSFASAERLAAHLGLAPGAVSPFGLINDAARSVRVLLDARLLSAVRVGFHPNVNTATIVLTGTDFGRFLAACGNPVEQFESRRADGAVPVG
ncbi:MAG TPA: prolyl-tRNA synthetase associated domain-containing protein [Vicinamibacterales bacterium]|nr:prolyl-tRNA synthetase associated domain-containing protein [Vicinamibacterales bacterium]HPW21286.1 prolyl-tRNA synthetase associated domain-containing protein [Vicinamibacterales bacterium]